MPIPERSAGREKTSNVTQVGGSEVLDRNTPIREDRIIRLKTVLSRTGLSRSTIYRKIAEGPSRLSSRSAPTGPAGMNPTSTAGSPIPPHGVQKARSMRSVEADTTS